MFIELSTERLRLKPIGREDAQFMFSQFSNAEVNRYLFDAEPFERIEQAEDLIAFYTEGITINQNRWILIVKATGEKVGSCGFHRWDRAQGSCELGYDLSPAFWHRGYMHEALVAALSFAAESMRVSSIEAHIAIGNSASERTAERLGFVDTGRTYPEVFRGREYPHKIYKLDMSAQ